MKRFLNFLNEYELEEGINDPNIFKAIFMAGGSGAGKSFVQTQATDVTQGLKVVNSDTAFEYLLDKSGMSKEMIGMNPDELEKFAATRTRAKKMTAKLKQMYLNGKLGLIIDGTAHNWEKIRDEKKELEDIGYDTYMIFVNTSLEVAQANNLKRPRKLTPDVIETSWKEVQANLGKLSLIFRGSFVIIDNDDPAENPKMINLFRTLSKFVKKFLKRPLKNKLAKQWIADQKGTPRKK